MAYVGGFRLGRVFGFEVRLDASWLIIFFLIVSTFATGVFPQAVPGHSMLAYLAMGVAATLLFFASIVAHEVAHSLVAAAKGIPIAGITLFIFGGVAHTRSEARTPRDEFEIAIVGPLTSFLLAVAFYAIAAAVGDASPVVLALASQLAAMNLALAVFNLLPGFPLDGGRVLRAAVWYATGDLTRATGVAAGAGRGLGLVLIGFGLWEVVRGDLIGGMWLAFIGWFLAQSAQETWRRHLAERSGALGY
jgi:Zn-dependent protease